MLLSKLDFNTRFEPISENRQKSNFDNALEGLRGIAALWVAFHHTLGGNFDPKFQPPSIFHHFTVGREAVLIFFVLSGYVIGLTCINKFSKNNAYSYLLKRIVRLYPMYLIAIVISYGIDYFIGHKSIDNWQIILGNIFFLQNLFVPVTSSNGALWSLNYEVVYYLVFLLIWKFRPKLLPLFIGLATIIILVWIFNPLPNILSGYLAGWIFWLLGLFLAWRVPSRVQNIKVPLISIFLLFYANKELRLGANILDILHFNNPGEIVTFGDITILPISILLIAIVSNRIILNKASNVYRSLYTISLIMPLSIIVYSFLKKGGFGSDNSTIAAVEIFLAIAFYGIKLSPSILKYLAFFGSISYGIYIFHGPIIGIVGYYFPFSGNVWSYLLRLIVWIVLTFSLSYLMDIKVQPKIRNWVRSNIPI